MGNVYLKLGQFEESLSSFNESYEIFKELKNTYESTDREEIRKGIERDASILYNTLGIHAAHQFSNKHWEKGVKLYRDIERMKQLLMKLRFMQAIVRGEQADPEE